MVSTVQLNMHKCELCLTQEHNWILRIARYLLGFDDFHLSLRSLAVLLWNSIWKLKTVYKLILWFWSNLFPLIISTKLRLFFSENIPQNNYKIYSVDAFYVQAVSVAFFPCIFIKCIMKCTHLIIKEQYFDFRSIAKDCCNSDMATRKQHCKHILQRHFTSEQSF